MKKTLKLLIVIIAALILLTGCAKLECNMDVKEDGSADVEYIIAISNEILKTAQEASDNLKATSELNETSINENSTSQSDSYMDSLDEMAQEAEKEGYKLEKYTDSDYTVYKLSKKFDNVEDVSLEEIFGEEVIKDSDDNKIKYVKNGSKVGFSQKAEFDLSEYQEGYVVVYSVNLPVKVSENNATEVDGNKLTWELEQGKKTTVEFTAGATEEDSGDILKTVLIIGGSVLGVAVIAGVVVLIIKKTKKNDIA